MTIDSIQRCLKAAPTNHNALLVCLGRTYVYAVFRVNSLKSSLQRCLVFINLHWHGREGREEHYDSEREATVVGLGMYRC